MRKLFLGLATAVLLAGAGQAQGAILVEAEAFAFQNEGTLTANAFSGVSAQDNVWSPTPIGTVTCDYYATGTAPRWFDALSLEFVPTAAEAASGWTTYRFRAYLQKGAYNTSWQHYQVLPGLMNPTNQDTNPPAPGSIVHPVSLSPNQTVGWVDFDIDVTEAGYTQGDGNVALTLRLWNWRVDAVELTAVPEPATVLVWALLGAASWLGMGVWRRGHNIGRRAWPEENRTAIHDIIARGGRD